MSKKINTSQEYYIYNADGELEDVISFTKKELLTYKKDFPDYTLESVDTCYSDYTDD